MIFNQKNAELLRGKERNVGRNRLIGMMNRL